MQTLLSLVAILIFPMYMALAASSDLLTMRISNTLVLTLALMFFAMALLVGMPVEEIGLHIACATIVLIVGFAFFALGWIGGGDAKLVAATTLWLGFGMMLPYLIYASLLGGALTLFLVAARRLPLPEVLRRVKWIDRLHDNKSGVPYGIALAAAGLLVYSDSVIFQRFLL